MKELVLLTFSVVLSIIYLSTDDYKGQIPAWCPGCGNFVILKAFKDAIVESNLEPHQFVVVSGIGQAGKFPHYLRCNTFNGLHGRTLPVATGIRLANHEMTVFAPDYDPFNRIEAFQRSLEFGDRIPLAVYIRLNERPMKRGYPLLRIYHL